MGLGFRVRGRSGVQDFGEVLIYKFGGKGLSVCLEFSIILARKHFWGVSFSR